MVRNRLRIGHRQNLQQPHSARRRQRHFITHARLEQCTRHRRNPADLARMAVSFINSHDGDGTVHALIVSIGDRRTKEDLITPCMQAGIDHLGNLQPLGQKPNAPIYLAQPLFAIQVVTVFRAITVTGSLMNGLDYLRSLVVDEVK